MNLNLSGFVAGTAAQQQCNPYPNARASSCSRSDRQRTAFVNLDTQLQEAQAVEQLSDFLLNTTIGMYKFLHPCATWWQEMAGVLTESSVIGRRRRQAFITEDELLARDLDRLRRDTGSDGGCIQYLIEQYLNISTTLFKNKFPNFYIPTTTIPTTTSPTTITTTEVTTSAPQTDESTSVSSAPIVSEVPASLSGESTTAETATTVEGPTITETSPTPSTPSTTGLPTTKGPILCVQCSGLDCLIDPVEKACPLNEMFCLITVDDMEGGRQITRGCASQISCLGFSGSQDKNLCNEVGIRILPPGNSCNFCCSGNSCNSPPQVTPNSDSLYP